MNSPNQFSLLRERRFLPFFLTQALGAFNDNVFKQALVIMIAFRVVEVASDPALVDFYSNLAAGLFILPFFLLSANAGQWAEKYEKSRLIRRIKLLEVGIMVLAAIGFAFASLPFLLLVLFLMGAQSTLFGPIKYSILPQALKPEEIVGGNALIEAGTFLTILLGTLLGGLLMASFDQGPAIVSIVVITIAVLGYLSARAIPPAPATAPDLPLDWNPLRVTARSLGYLRGNRAVLHSVLGISWFWFFGSMFIAQLPNYTKLYLGGNEQLAPMVLTLFSVGIGLGSLMCERLSGRKVEIGLVPIGAFGLTALGIDLYFARPEPAPIQNLGIAAFLASDGAWRIVADLFLIGLFGGFYIVPLFALVQTRSDRRVLSRVIAANNILNAAFMVGAALLAIVLFKLGLSIPEVLLVTAVLNAIVAIYIFTLVPEFLMRFLVWILINTLYRLRVEGLEKIPDQGPCIVVANHVSYVDALIIGGSVRRPIRFVMDRDIFRIPVLNFIFRTARAIPIASAKIDPVTLEQAFEAVDEALAEGEVVGIFPEGAITRTGEIQPFRPGIERILARRPVPVVPIALRGLWGSLFSRKDSALGRMRLPRRFWSRIAMVVGDPIPPAAASAAALEAKVRELRGDVA